MKPLCTSNRHQPRVSYNLDVRERKRERERERGGGDGVEVGVREDIHRNAVDARQVYAYFEVDADK